MFVELMAVMFLKNTLYFNRKFR